MRTNGLLTRLTRVEQRARPAPHPPADLAALRARVQAIVDAYEACYPLDEGKYSLAMRYCRAVGISMAELKARCKARRTP